MLELERLDLLITINETSYQFNMSLNLAFQLTSQVKTLIKDGKISSSQNIAMEGILGGQWLGFKRQEERANLITASSRCR